jgi:hypothetical protein
MHKLFILLGLICLVQNIYVLWFMPITYNVNNPRLYEIKARAAWFITFAIDVVWFVITYLYW